MLLRSGCGQALGPERGADGVPNSPTALETRAGYCLRGASSGPCWALIPEGQDGLAHRVTPGLAQCPDQRDVTGVPSRGTGTLLGPPPPWLVDQAW